MSSWYRAYAETLNDPKIQTLPLEAFKAWHNALYLASSIDSKDGNIGTLESVSFAFRETKSSVSSAFHTLVERGLLVTVGETFRIVSWKKRQFKSDTSTERVRKFRNTTKRSRNVTETAPDTDTDTDTDIVVVGVAHDARDAPAPAHEAAQPGPPEPASQCDPTDVAEVTMEICRTAGIRHVDPGTIIKHQQLVREWLNDGFDLESTIMPVVRQALSDATERISSLKYFDRSIRQSHARKEAHANGHQPTSAVDQPLNPMVRAFGSRRSRRAAAAGADDDLRLPPGAEAFAG